MANILAAANGNWSSTATWIGGVLPTASDSVYANGRTITIDQNIDVARLSNRPENGATGGGSFSCTTSTGVVRTINANIIEAYNYTCLFFSHSAVGTAAYVNFLGGAYATNISAGTHAALRVNQFNVNTLFTTGPCYGFAGFNSAGINSSGLAGAVHYHTGNCYGSPIQSQSAGWLLQGDTTPRHTIYLTGDLYGGSGGSGSGFVTPVTSFSNIYITGNIYSGRNFNSPGLALQNSCTFVVTGNAYALNGGPAISHAYAGGSPTLTLIGTAVGGNASGQHNSNGLFTQYTGTFYIKRAKGGSSGPGRPSDSQINPGVLVGAQTPTVFVEELEFGDRGASPIRGFVKMVSGSNNVLIGRLKSGSAKTLVDSTTFSSLLPATSDVRSGVSYNSGASVGSCIIPSASSVAKDIPVDSSVGTAFLTQANVWNYVSPISPGSVGEKLKKTATAADLVALG